MATYVNDLRLKEIATGDESGTWGTSTNTNLELIAEAFSFGTEAITTNADTHTTTIADGATDPGRSIFLKYTGTLDSACTITIGPNTVSKLWFIENATSGSQNIIISQGSGANITIANGQTKAIYSDGAGSGAAMVDAFQDLSIPDLFIDDDLTFTSDSAVITFGADGDTTLTHTDGSGLTLNSTNKLMFNDASQFIQGSSATVLSLGATDEIDLTATAIDVNGTMDVSGAITSSAGATITLPDNNVNLNLVCTDTDGSSGPILDLTRDAGDSPSDDDIMGTIRFRNDDSDLNMTSYVLLQALVQDVTSGTEDGRLKFIVMSGGSSRNFIDMSGSNAIVVNEDSQNIDFRVESDSRSHMLFVDGSSDRIGMGSCSDPSTFDSRASTLVIQQSGDVGMALVSGDNSDCRIAFTIAADTGIANGAIRYDNNDDTFSVETAGTARLSIDSTGRALIGADSGDSFNADSMLRIQRTGDRAFIQIKTDADQDSGILFGDVDDDVECSILYEPDKKGITLTANNGNRRIDLGTTESVFNEDTEDVDFRVESDGNTSMLFVEAGTDRVGIGTNSPDAEVHISGTSPHIDLGPKGSNRAKLGYASTNLLLGTTSSGGEVIIKNNVGSTDAPESSGDEIARLGDTVVFNESSRDQDFRVESDATADCFFIDSGNDVVLVKNSGGAFEGSTAQSMHVRGGSTGSTSPVMMITDGDGSVEGDSTILEVSFTADGSFSEARYITFRAGTSGTQGAIKWTGDGTVTYGASSDERLKENIEDTASKWDALKAIKVRDFNWKNSGKSDTGFIAQELNEHWPNAVSEGGENLSHDPWSVDYGKLTPILTKALQEAMEKIEHLESEIVALKGE